MTKVLPDFTLVLQMRHNFEVGGVQFSLLVVQNQVSCFVAGWLYLKDYGDAYEDESDEVGGNRNINAEMLWAGLLGLLGLFLVSSLAFIGLMVRKFLLTFSKKWEDWMTDRPEWLTDNVISTIPDEYLKKTEVKRPEKEEGGKTRRSSAFGGGGRIKPE